MSRPARVPQSPLPGLDRPQRERPRRNRLFLAFLGGAVTAFALGRLTAPDREHSQAPLRGAAHTDERSGELARGPASPRAATDPMRLDADATATPRGKEAEIIRMLSRFKEYDIEGLDSELLALLGWTNNANEDDLALFMALGKEMLSEQDIYESLILPAAFVRLARLDPASAFESYLALDEENRTNEITRIIFNTWILQGSPRDALDHALAIQRTDASDDSAKRRIVGDMIGLLMKHDPAQARALAAEFARSDDPLEQKAANQAAGSVLNEIRRKQGSEAALEWLADWPDAKTRAKLHRQLTDSLLQSGNEADRRAGMDLFAQTQDPDSDTVRLAVKQKIEANTIDAQAWALALPAGETRSAAVQEVTNILANKDQMGAAARWLADQPAHRDFDPVYARLAVAVFQTPQDYPAALAWMKRVTNPDTAAEVRGALIDQWRTVEPERAAQVLGVAMETAISTAR